MILNQIKKYDPTKTLSLRNRFVSAMNKRFNELKKYIKQTIVDNDAFGISAAVAEKGRDSTKITSPTRPLITTMQAAEREAFAFGRTKDKINAFMRWLKQQEDFTILSRSNVARLSLEQAWTDTYIMSAYQRGIAMARGQLKKKGIIPNDMPLQPGIQGVLNQPIHADRIGALFTRTFEDLKTVTEQMNGEIRRRITDGLTTGLSKGIAEGLSPRVIASDIMQLVNDRVEHIGRNRATLIARTEVIRAHHQASIQEYKMAAVELVELQAEWSTAGDFRVCPICDAAAKKDNGYGPGIYTIDQIEPLIPAHPQCLLDGQVKIYTSKGWKQIKKIKAGDLVLTHKGRFRKVLSLYFSKKQTPNAIQFKFGGTQQMKLSVTDNHPVLINGKWIEAKNIKQGDEIQYLANKCQRCNNYDVYYKKYCSRRCLSKDITDKQCLDEISDEIVRVIGNHRGEFKFVSKKIIDIKKWKVKHPRTLYNFSVDEDESYIANGFVVHNCRCAAIPANVGEERKKLEKNKNG